MQILVYVNIAVEDNLFGKDLKSASIDTEHVRGRLGLGLAGFFIRLVMLLVLSKRPTEPGRLRAVDSSWVEQFLGANHPALDPEQIWGGAHHLMCSAVLTVSQSCVVFSQFS